MTTADRYSADAGASSSPDPVRRPTAAIVVLTVLSVVGLGAWVHGSNRDGRRPLPAQFSATTPSVTPKTGDEIARIRSKLDDPGATTVAIGDIKDARVFPLNGDSPDQAHDEWRDLEGWIVATCEQARSKGWMLQLTATTDASGTKEFNAELAVRRSQVVADLLDKASCWERGQIRSVALAASTEGGAPDQSERRVSAIYIRPAIN